MPIRYLQCKVCDSTLNPKTQFRGFCKACQEATHPCECGCGNPVKSWYLYSGKTPKRRRFLPKHLARTLIGSSRPSFSEAWRENLVRSHTPWSREEDRLLVSLYPRLVSKKLREFFPRFTAQQIAVRANHLGAKKTKQALSEAAKANMKSRWSGHVYKIKDDGRRGPSWGQQRRNARYRAEYKCEFCGASEDVLGAQLVVHHIVPFREFGDDYVQANRMSNLVALCRQCHPKIEQQIFTNREGLLASWTD